MARILIIDDEQSHIFLNQMLFKSIGITDVDAKISAIDALRYLEDCDKKSSFPELIFVDMNMTGMNGLAFLDTYEQKFPDYSDKTRVIVLTNSILDKDKEEAFKYRSVLHFWSKPLTKNILENLMQKIEAGNS